VTLELDSTNNRTNAEWSFSVTIDGRSFATRAPTFAELRQLLAFKNIHAIELMDVVAGCFVDPKPDFAKIGPKDCLAVILAFVAYERQWLQKIFTAAAATVEMSQLRASREKPPRPEGTPRRIGGRRETVGAA